MRSKALPRPAGKITSTLTAQPRWIWRITPAKTPVEQGRAFLGVVLQSHALRAYPMEIRIRVWTSGTSNEKEGLIVW